MKTFGIYGHGLRIAVCRPDHYPVGRYCVVYAEDCNESRSFGETSDLASARNFARYIASHCQDELRWLWAHSDTRDATASPTLLWKATDDLPEAFIDLVMAFARAESKALGRAQRKAIDLHIAEYHRVNFPHDNGSAS